MLHDNADQRCNALSSMREDRGVKIDVRDNQIEPALKALKKLMVKTGLFQEMKRRESYEKPSVKRKRKQAQARKKLRKAMKRAQPRDDE